MDRFCDALISIREEIAQIEKGKVDANNNVLKVSASSILFLCETTVVLSCILALVQLFQVLILF